MQQEELSPHCSTGQGHDFLNNYFMGNSTSAYEFAAYLRSVAKDFDRAGFDATADDFKAAATYIDFLQKQVAQFLVDALGEGKKTFRQTGNVGKAKYTISYHDGKKKHKDGSDFFDMEIFKNKPSLEKFKKDLLKKGYKAES